MLGFAGQKAKLRLLCSYLNEQEKTNKFPKGFVDRISTIIFKYNILGYRCTKKNRISGAETDFAQLGFKGKCSLSDRLQMFHKNHS